MSWSSGAIDPKQQVLLLKSQLEVRSLRISTPAKYPKVAERDRYKLESANTHNKQLLKQLKDEVLALKGERDSLREQISGDSKQVDEATLRQELIQAKITIDNRETEVKVS